MQRRSTFSNELWYLPFVNACEWTNRFSGITNDSFETIWLKWRKIWDDYTLLPLLAWKMVVNCAVISIAMLGNGGFASVFSVPEEKRVEGFFFTKPTDPNMNQIVHWVNKFWELARKKLKSKKVWYKKKVEIPLETLVDSRFVTKKSNQNEAIAKAYLGLDWSLLSPNSNW